MRLVDALATLDLLVSLLLEPSFFLIHLICYLFSATGCLLHQIVFTYACASRPSLLSSKWYRKVNRCEATSKCVWRLIHLGASFLSIVEIGVFCRDVQVRDLLCLSYFFFENNRSC